MGATSKLGQGIEVLTKSLIWIEAATGKYIAKNTNVQLVRKLLARRSV